MASRDVEDRAALHAALSDPHRVALCDELALSDRSPSDLAGTLDIPSNLLAHHVAVLERAGLVERVRSGGDGRRRYLRLRPERFLDVLPRPVAGARSVLFVCTRNSARSPLAAALWSRASDVPGASAGTHPAERTHPLAVAAAARHGLDLGAATPRSLEDVETAPDLVVTVCDEANEEWAGGPVARLHWSVPDPARAGSEAAFEATVEALGVRIARLAEAMHRPVSGGST